MLTYRDGKAIANYLAFSLVVLAGVFELAGLRTPALWLLAGAFVAGTVFPFLSCCRRFGLSRRPGIAAVVAMVLVTIGGTYSVHRRINSHESPLVPSELTAPIRNMSLVLTLDEQLVPDDLNDDAIMIRLYSRRNPKSSMLEQVVTQEQIRARETRPILDAISGLGKFVCLRWPTIQRRWREMAMQLALANGQ